MVNQKVVSSTRAPISGSITNRRTTGYGSTLSVASGASPPPALSTPQSVCIYVMHVSTVDRIKTDNWYGHRWSVIHVVAGNVLSKRTRDPTWARRFRGPKGSMSIGD